MKKIQTSDRSTVLSVGLSRWKNELKRAPKRYNPERARKLPRQNLFQKSILAPELISIYQIDGRNCAYIQTIRFIKEIKAKLSDPNYILDFSETKKISAAALVLVYAAIENAQTHNSRKSIILSKNSPAVNIALKQTNIVKLATGKEIKYALANGRSMPIVSSIGDAYMHDIVDYIQNRIFDQQMSPDTEYVYSDAVSETINNVGLHAYPQMPVEDRRWWLFCQAFEKTLYLAIYDTGVGIPKTVGTKKWFIPAVKATHPEHYEKIETHERDIARLAEILPKTLSDQEMINLSMRGDVSRTKLPKHGQGSKSIKALVSETKDGVLWVFSNKGLYKLKEGEDHPRLLGLTESFPGTLVQWNIELT